MKLKAGLIASLALIAGSAAADDSGFYAGAGVGWSQASLPKSKITNTFVYAFEAADAPLESWSAKTDDTSMMWSAFAGYRFFKYLAVEVGYLDTGTVSYRGDGVADLFDYGPVNARGDLDWKATGWPVSVLGIWPIDDTWSVFGRVGAYFGDVKADLRLKLYDETGSESGKKHMSDGTTEFIGGVGVDARFLDNWAARLEWLTVPSLGNNDSGSADWNGVQFSLYYGF